jgi:acyl-CoA synthetase (AMP-forming)/AMP-acid ligase II/ABC-type branched-subunit amino acid transport system substrate-binding protein
MRRQDYLADAARYADPGALRGLTASSALAATATTSFDRPAVVEGNLRPTWGELATQAESLARRLAGQGIGHGAIVGLHQPNSLAYVVAHLAIAATGAVTLPLHMPYRESELETLLGFTEANALIVDRTALGKVAAIRSRLPALRLVISADEERLAPPGADATFATLPDAHAELPALEPNDPFCLIPTSGTESLRPKLCMHSHDGLLSNAHAFVEQASVAPGDAILCGSGYTHAFGLLAVHLALVSGATLLALRKFEAGRFLEICEREGATLAWAVPAQLDDLLAVRRRESAALALREVRTAGAAVSGSFARAVQTALAPNVVVHWGMSELGGGITTYGLDAGGAESRIGRPLPGADVRIVSFDGDVCPPGVVGELWYRRADLFRGYYRDPDTTRAACTEEGWLRTGDRASLDEHGHVHYHGRSKDLINRGGFKISAYELESHLARLPQVRQTAVVAIPDDRLGERCCMIAALHEGATLTLDDVVAYLDARAVAKYKWPERLVILDALPTTPTGKVAKHLLRRSLSTPPPERKETMKRESFLTSVAAVGAASLLPRRSWAATGPTTVRIGYLDSFSGVFSDIAAYQKAGAQLALDDVNKNSRVKFEFVYGDDGSKPAMATTEARRLIQQESVDVLFGCISSANGLALGPLALDAGIFNLELGPFESSITGAKATKLTYRFGPNSRMYLKPLARRLLALGKKWYFIQADYALGKDSYAQLSQILRAAGGTEVGVDVLPLGTKDFSSVLTKVRNSDADVLVLANSGLDAANTIKQFVDFGLNKKLKLAGINLEDFYYKALPLDDIAGATFPMNWGPTVSPSAEKLAARLRRDIKEPLSSRHYIGYVGLLQLVDRLNAAGTTSAEKVALSFSNHSFDAAKGSKSLWSGIDHQCQQDVYAGTIVTAKRFEKTQFMFDVVAEVPASESDGTAESPWAVAAKANMALQTIPNRESYTPKILA